MARAKSEKRIKAKEIWDKSKGQAKVKDISLELGVSESQIRKWKSIDKWEKVILPIDKKAPLHKKRGVKKGTRNAVGNKGGGAKKGNKNRVTTGEYETIMFETLSLEEIRLVNSMDFNKAEELNREIALLTVREFRIMKKIKENKDKKLILKGVANNKGKDGKGRLIAEGTNSYTENVENFIMRLEESLTRVQDRKIKAIETLARIEQGYARIELEREKFEFEKGGNDDNSDNIKNWIESTKVEEEEVSKLFINEVDYEEI